MFTKLFALLGVAGLMVLPGCHEGCCGNNNDGDRPVYNDSAPVYRSDTDFHRNDDTRAIDTNNNRYNNATDHSGAGGRDKNDADLKNQSRSNNSTNQYNSTTNPGNTGAGGKTLNDSTTPNTNARGTTTPNASGSDTPNTGAGGKVK